MVGLTRNADPAQVRDDPQLFVVTRSQWNAHPPQEGIPRLRHPMSRLRFTHTASPACGTLQECKRTLKKMQFLHMDGYGMQDIAHNFLIGGDGWIFEGRGWDVEADVPPIHRDPIYPTLQIAYIGDYDDEEPPVALLKAAMEIVVYATRKEILLHFYSVSHLS